MLTSAAARSPVMTLPLAVTADVYNPRFYRHRVVKMLFGDRIMVLVFSVYFGKGGQAQKTDQETDAGGFQKCRAALATATKRKPITMPRKVSLDGSNPGNI